MPDLSVDTCMPPQTELSRRGRDSAMSSPFGSDSSVTFEDDDEDEVTPLTAEYQPGAGERRTRLDHQRRLRSSDGDSDNMLPGWLRSQLPSRLSLACFASAVVALFVALVADRAAQTDQLLHNLRATINGVHSKEKHFEDGMRLSKDDPTSYAYLGRTIKCSSFVY